MALISYPGAIVGEAFSPRSFLATRHYFINSLPLEG